VCYVIFISIPLQIQQIGCYINTAVFLEISVFGQGGLVLPLRKGGFRNLYVPNVVYVTFDLATD